MVLMLAIFFQPHVAFAQLRGNTNTLLNPLCPTNDPSCDRSDVEGLLNSIVDWLLRIATPIAVGMILIGAFQMVFAGGNERSRPCMRMCSRFTLSSRSSSKQGRCIW